MNSDREEKLRQDEWLISAILREINQLEWMGEPGRKFSVIIQSVILSGAGTSRSEVSAESKDPCTLLPRKGCVRDVHPRPRLFTLCLAADAFDVFTG